jgi:pimeloyl-ACP methyl ester carboxylesterase
VGLAKTVVLVHGAWHGAWCFERVVALLAAADLDVVAVDLPGHGNDPGPFTDLVGDAAAVEAVLDELVDHGRADHGVVLLGHSYGGGVITQAGLHPAVAHLVYLCAFAITESESAAHAAPLEAATISHDGRPSLADALVFHDDATTTLRPEGARECLYNLCDEDTVSWALARLGKQPTSALTQSPTRVAWRERPSTYVTCSHDMGVHPELQRILAKRCTTELEWPTGHSPFASHPDLVAELLVNLATT